MRSWVLCDNSSQRLSHQSTTTCHHDLAAGAVITKTCLLRGQGASHSTVLYSTKKCSTIDPIEILLCYFIVLAADAAAGKVELMGISLSTNEFRHSTWPGEISGTAVDKVLFKHAQLINCLLVKYICSAMADEKQEEVPPADSAANPDWGDDISPSKDGGLFKSILTAGHGVEHPLHGDEVSVHYTGRLLSGEVFDSSVDRGELFQFKIGQNQVIKGWDVGVATMVKGEKCVLTCNPDYAYGSSGSAPKIPPNATLQFEVELFDWHGEDLTGDGGIVKSIVSKGDGYSKPTDGAQIEGMLTLCLQSILYIFLPAHIRGSYKGRVIEERDISFEYGEGKGTNNGRFLLFMIYQKILLLHMIVATVVF